MPGIDRASRHHSSNNEIFELLDVLDGLLNVAVEFGIVRRQALCHIFHQHPVEIGSLHEIPQFWMHMTRKQRKRRLATQAFTQSPAVADYLAKRGVWAQ